MLFIVSADHSHPLWSSEARVCSPLEKKLGIVRNNIPLQSLV